MFLSASYLVQELYLVKFTSLEYQYRYFKCLYLYLQQYKAQRPDKKGIILWKALSTDTSFSNI